MRALALSLALSLAPALALADKPAAPAAGADPAKAKQMMEAMERQYAPGPMHQWLKAHFAGSWTTESRALVGPAASEKPAAGTAEVKAVHGDRFLVEEFTSTRMGKPMSGTIWFGYDNLRKRFTSSEIDTMGTSITTLSGTLDEATKTLTLTGPTWSHMLNREVTMRVVARVESDKKRVMEFYSPGPDGKEAKRMELVYTRK